MGKCRHKIGSLFGSEKRRSVQSRLHIGRKGPCGCGKPDRGFGRGKASGEPERLKRAKLGSRALRIFG